MLDERLSKIAEGVTPENSKEELRILMNCGIISAEEYALVLAHIEMKQKEEAIKKHHPYDIYQGKDGKWYTYVKDGDKRKKIKRNTEQEVIDVVVEHLKMGQVVTVDDVFSEFLELKKQTGIKLATIERYTQVFERHFITTGNHKKDIKQLSSEWFADFIESEVGRCQLNAKAISSLKGIVKGIIKRGRRKGLINYGFSEIADDLDVKPFREHRDNDSQIFTEKELPLLLSYLSDHKDTHNLILLLMLITGLRVGEAVCLKFSDFLTPSSFQVKRAETRYKAEDGYRYEISNVKTENGYRTVYFPENYAWIIDELKKLNPFSEFLATNSKGQRLTTAAIRARLYHVCDKVGIDRKSCHKTRKTYCSILLDGNFDHSFVTSQMGHSTIITSERHYHYDRKSAKEKQSRVNNIVDFKAV